MHGGVLSACVVLPVACAILVLNRRIWDLRLRRCVWIEYIDILTLTAWFRHGLNISCKCWTPAQTTYDDMHLCQDQLVWTIAGLWACSCLPGFFAQFVNQTQHPCVNLNLLSSPLKFAWHSFNLKFKFKSHRPGLSTWALLRGFTSPVSLITKFVYYEAPSIAMVLDVDVGLQCKLRV
jgi:hypothetical protein